MSKESSLQIFDETSMAGEKIPFPQWSNGQTNYKSALLLLKSNNNKQTA